MVNPIFQKGVGDVQEPVAVFPIQSRPVPGGVADVPSYIDQERGQGTFLEKVIYFFRRIYSALVSVVDALKRILCGCYSKRAPDSIDEIANELASFNNSGVEGQIHGIYITTNETNLGETRRVLENQTQPSEGEQKIHIGCATWHNFDIICARKSTYGLIVDFNPRNTEFIRKTIEWINTSESRDAFKRAVIQYLDSLTGRDRDLFFHRDQQGLPTERIERELSREGSWLQSEESYLYMKQELVSKGRLISITEDIRNFEHFSKMRQCLDRNHIHIDTLYLSNISTFMNTQNDRDSFAKSVKQLLNKDSIFIHCPKIQQGDNEIILSQKATLGGEILDGSYNDSQLFEIRS